LTGLVYYKSVKKRIPMCSECDWVAAKNDASHRFQDKCDCGNFKWQQTPELAEATAMALGMGVVWHSIFRCTKCDALRSGEHLMQRGK